MASISSDKNFLVNMTMTVVEIKIRVNCGFQRLIVLV